jgi:hypothetical protein
MNMSTKSETEFEKIATNLVKKKVEVSKMFGMPCYKIKGKAFAGLYEGDMVFKLSGDEHMRAISLTGSRLFDPMGGRPMKEWIQVSSKNMKHWEDLSEAALKYVNGKK